LASIKELPSDRTFRFERIGAHTHVKGLGLSRKGTATKIKEGLVGQERGREAAGLVVRMIREGRLSGKTADRDKVTVKDVEKVDQLFMDIGEAAEYLKKFEEKLMTH
jgi:DNA helicase TIP49 (TBP-interacting protein)